MNPVFKLFFAVAVVSSYTLNTEAMGLCGFQRKVLDKIPKVSECNCKNKTNATSPSEGLVTETESSSKLVPYVALMTSASKDLTTTTTDITNSASPSVDVATEPGGSSKSVSYVNSMTSASDDLTTTTAAEAPNEDAESMMSPRKTSAYSRSTDTGSYPTSDAANELLTTSLSTFEAPTDSPCPPYNMDPLELSLEYSSTVNKSFVNENCTQRCVCNSAGRLTCSNYSCGDDSKCGVEDNVRECYCDDGSIKGDQGCWRPSGCQDLYSVGIRDNGVYTVYPPGWSSSSMQVYCDMTSSPQGGWTVFQRRINGSVDFYRNWTEYKDGFGSLDHEFWLGNEALYYLTNLGYYQLRIDLSNDEGNYYADYNLFRIGDEETDYRISGLVGFTDGGVVYDALKYHINVPFSTYDRDMDLSGGENCAETNRGGWWFISCVFCHLNGVYGETQKPGISWRQLPGGQFNIKSTEMKIRPQV